MAAYYLDSSALVKRYITETGSTWIRGLCDQAMGHDLYTVTLTGPELIAAVTRRARGGQLPVALAAQAVHRFRQDWQLQYQPIEPLDPIINRAMDIAEIHRLRGYDAVHVATAIELHIDRQGRGFTPLLFISADQEQLHVAVTEGLTVDDPNRYR